MAGKVLAAKRPIRQLSIREKIAAIDRVHSGESKASVARDIGVPESTLRGWCKSEDKLRVVSRTCGSPDSDGDKDDHQPLNMTTSQLTHTHTALPPQAQPLVPSNVTPKTQPEVNEALWFWLKQQQQVSLGSPLLDPKLASLDKDGSSWFWRWYKNFGYSQFPDNGPLSANNARSMLDTAMLNVNDNNNVLMKTKEDTTMFAKRKEEDLKWRTEGPEESSTTKKRKLDESEDDEEDEPPATPAEAVGHGEKFLRWLECCSDPSVTAMQILQFRYLLNNVRACANRKAKQSKTKATRK